MKKFENLYNTLKSTLVITEAVKLPILQKIINANIKANEALEVERSIRSIAQQLNNLIYNAFYTHDVIDRTEYNILSDTVGTIAKEIFKDLQNGDRISKEDAFKMMVNSTQDIDESEKIDIIRKYIASVEEAIRNKPIEMGKFQTNRLDPVLKGFLQKIDAGNIDEQDVLILDKDEIRENFRKQGKIAFSNVFGFKADLSYVGRVTFDTDGKIETVSTYLRNYRNLIELSDIFLCITRTKIDKTVGKAHERLQNREYLKQNDALQRDKNLTRYRSELFDRQRNRDGLDLQKYYQDTMTYVKDIGNKIRTYLTSKNLTPFDLDDELVKHYIKLIHDYKELFSRYGNGSDSKKFMGMEPTWTRRSFDELKDKANEINQLIENEA